MTRSTRRAALGTISMVWVAQVAVMALQLLYTGVVSRAVTPAGFGSYAVALAVTSLGGMLASGGLPSAAARRQAEGPSGDRAIATLALVLGFSAAGAFALSAPFWARLWGDADAAVLIRMQCIGLAVGSYNGVLGGLARRAARFRLLTVVTVGSSLLGMVVGGVLVWATRAPWSLTVMSIVTTCLSTAILALAFRDRATPTRRLAQVGHDAWFGVKSLSSSLISYVSYTVPAWLMSRTLGPGTLGDWNRATAVGQVPLEGVGRAITTVLYPRFRHDTAPTPESARRLARMCSGVALVALPLTALVLPSMPLILRILLGPQWAVAATMVPYILAATTVSLLVTVLAMAAEASNHFEIVGSTQATILVVMLVSGVALVVTHSWTALAVGYLTSQVAAHLVQVRHATRSGLLDRGTMRAWYPVAGASALAMGGLGVLAATSLGQTWALILVLAVLACGFLATLIGLRRRIHPFELLA